MRKGFSTMANIKTKKQIECHTCASAYPKFLF